MLRSQAARLQRGYLDEDYPAAEAIEMGFEPELLATPDLPVRSLVLYPPVALPGQLEAAWRLVLRKLGADYWRCLPFQAKPLLGNPRHPYRPVQLARRRLAAWGAAPTYRGAYQIPLAATAEFMRVLFRISRYDGAAPEYILFAPGTDDCVASLCRYGNLHVDCRPEQLELLRAVFRSAGLHEWEGEEYERYSARGAGHGRRTRRR
ncbi:hypothetical protein GCM10027048_04300 [Hymenobacter coalescens]